MKQVEQYEIDAKKFKAFCDPNRLWILQTLKKQEQCACKLLELLNVGQSTLSHHMKILSDANVVNIRKDGKWCYYSLSNEGIQELEKYLHELQALCDKQGCCK